MESIILFVAGFALTWPALIALLVFGIIFESNEAHAWAVFTGLIAVVISYFMFSIPLPMLIAGLVAYFVVGFIWSFYRYKRHTDMIVKNLNTGDYSKHSCEAAIDQMKPARMLSKITSWVIIWPFSFVENYIGDFISTIQHAIETYFRGVYARIFDSAVSKIIYNNEHK
jgi:hypothetical protein